MAAPQPSGQSEGSSAILWIVAAIFVGLGLIWITFKQKIVGAYFTVKLWEINFISLFTNRLEDVRTTILMSDPTQLTFRDIVHVGQAVGNVLRIPFVILLILFAILVFLGHSTRVFKRTYNMRNLIEEEKVNWPQITPILNVDLIKTNIDQGPWAMAITPMQFCKRFNLLEKHKRQPQEGMVRKEWNRIEVTLKRGLANKVFALQLGPLWQGTAKLPPHTKALFAVFAARYCGDSKAAASLLANISQSSSATLNYEGVEPLLKKHINHKGIQKIMQSHAYVLTIMASMLEAAREDGVQAAADFLWLKLVDRRLWYMLNTVGRQTPFTEVAGPFAHWIAEKEIGRGLVLPMVEEATNALALALQDIIYTPDED